MVELGLATDAGIMCRKDANPHQTHLVVVHIRPAYDSIDLRVLQVREPKRLKSRPHLLLVQRAVTVLTFANVG